MIGDSGQWNVFWFNGMDCSTTICKARGDTLILGNSYKKIKEYWMPTFNYQAFVREDTATKKVWYILKDSTTEKILYDFSLQQGDSIYLWFNNYSSYLKKGWYHVDSVKAISIQAGNRKILFLTNPNNPPFTNNQSPILQWIEGVGSTISPLYPILNWNYNYPYWFNCSDYSHDVTCSFLNGIRQYHNTCYDSYLSTQYMSWIVDSCTFEILSGVKENKSFISNFGFSPNPSQNITTVYFELNKSSEIYLSISNVLGMKVREIGLGNLPSGKHAIPLQSDISAGVYFLTISSGNAQFAAGKLVIQ